MNHDKPCIHLANLRVEHSGVPVYENLTLQIENGTLSALTGRKPECWDVLMRMIGGLQQLQSGQIELWGVPITQISRRSLNSHVCYVPRQQHPLFAYTVLEFVLQGCEPRLKPLQAPAETDRERVRDILRMMNIEKLVYRDCSLLTNRERQLAVIARAMMQDARLLMLDAPMAGLTEEDQADVMAVFKDQVRQGKTVLVAMEDPCMAMDIADRLIIFDNQGIADILDSAQPDFRSKANNVLQRLLLLDPQGHLLDPMLQGMLIEDPDGFAEQEKMPPGQPKGNDRLF